MLNDWRTEATEELEALPGCLSVVTSGSMASYRVGEMLCILFLLYQAVSVGFVAVGMIVGGGVKFSFIGGLVSLVYCSLSIRAGGLVAAVSHQYQGHDR